jgi:hypothetical protein
MTAPHDWFIENRLEYATRTLEPEDERRFEAHLAGCEECQLEIARIDSDLRWLPAASMPVAPRAGFTKRAAERVIGRKTRQSPQWIMPAMLAASVLLVLGGWLATRAQVGRLERQLASQRQAIAALMDTLSISRGAGRVLQASVDVNGTRGGLLIFADETTHRWNVVVHGLPPAPPGYRYQFWFICDDGMVRGNEVQASTSKPTMFTTGMPQPQSCPAVKGAELTEEPMAGEGGAPKGKSLAQLML